MPRFSHLHVHTQYSLLDGASAISQLYQKAIADQMPALAITDHGNMFGVFQFVAEAYQHKLHPDDPQDRRLKVKPIVGCEFYIVEDRFKRQFTREERDQRYHQVLLAKNEQGYRNLVKLCSLGYIEGLYGKYPRIDKSLIQQYHEGLIATTCCLAASVPRMILKKSEEEAEQEFRWWLDIFGTDYYIELQRHGIPEQDRVNAILLKWAKKYQVKPLPPTTLIMWIKVITMHTTFYFASIQVRRKVHRRLKNLQMMTSWCVTNDLHFTMISFI